MPNTALDLCLDRREKIECNGFRRNVPQMFHRKIHYKISTTVITLRVIFKG